MNQAPPSKLRGMTRLYTRAPQGAGNETPRVGFNDAKYGVAVKKMVIQHNKSAMNAQRQLGANNTSAAKSLEKLSSGLKINRAGDDAAGLAISEKMRGQIHGIMMGTQNVDMGVNIVQTADGGLNEIHSIMHRMRELTVQASNGTYLEDDRQAIQKEIASLTSEINRLSESVNYNTIPPFDGSITGDYEYHYGIKGPNTKSPTDPASITAGVSFSGPVEISAGIAEIDTGSHSQNSAPYYSNTAPYSTGPSRSYVQSNLLALDANSSFPKQGLFAIQVTTGGGGTVNAVLDFAAVNSAGDFTLADFEQFFADKFKDVADFSVDASGNISIESKGSGGASEKIEIGKTDLTTAELTAALGHAPPADIRYVNSALFDTQAYSSQSESSGIKSSVALTQDDLETLKTGGLDAHLEDAGGTLWQLLSDVNIQFELKQYTGSGTSTQTALYSLDKATSGAVTYAQFRQDVQALAPNAEFSSVDISGSPSWFVDRDGFVYVQIGISANKAPAYSGGAYFWNTTTFPDYSSNVSTTTTGYGPKASEQNAMSGSLPTVTSAYTVPDPLTDSGTLQVTIGSVPGKSTVSVTGNYARSGEKRHSS